MRLRDTTIGAWAALCRLQSTPLTLVLLLLGYGSVTGTVLTEDVIPLVVMGCLGHWAVYAHNDYVDSSEDYRSGKFHKPLVSGDIHHIEAKMWVYLGSVGSIIVGAYFMESLPALLWGAAVVTGISYNYASKKVWFSGGYLSIWGVVVIFSSSMYAGGLPRNTFLLAVAVGIHMLIMTVEGDLKDLTSDEPHIPHLLGCYVEDGVMRISAKLLVVVMVAHIAEGALLLETARLSGAGPPVAVAISFLFLVSMLVLFRILREKPWNPVEIKEDIVIYTCLSAAAILVASVPMVGVIESILLLAGTLVWGLGSQYLLYGDPLYFP